MRLIPLDSVGASVLLVNVPFLLTLTLKKDFHLPSFDGCFRDRGKRSGVIDCESRERDQFSNVAER
jgi:hypothetical protein